MNSSGTGYGNNISFTTGSKTGLTFNPNLSYGNVKDIDGNIYKTISIGTQTWMAENLKTTKYRDGSMIRTTNPTYDVNVETYPKYQWVYDGIEENVDVYGRLYTWYVVTDSKGLCPVGWHVPSDTEWTTLVDFLIKNGYAFSENGIDIAKSLAAKSGWDPEGAYDGSPGGNQAVNNSSGFTAMPSGIRTNSNFFNHIGTSAAWWTSTESGRIDAWEMAMASFSGIIQGGGTAAVSGFSVRCIKD
jgi:uncharacterized protein (TIGR02145 family)